MAPVENKGNLGHPALGRHKDFAKLLQRSHPGTLRYHRLLGRSGSGKTRAGMDLWHRKKTRGQLLINVITAQPV
jgi:hypothetical protein